VGSRSTRPVVRDRSRRESDKVEVEVEVEVEIETEPRYIIHQLRTNGRRRETIGEEAMGLTL